MTDQQHPTAQATAGRPGKIAKAAGGGHDHWTWACPKEDGGCGYQTPWYMKTEAAAQKGLDAHQERCRAEPRPTT